MGRCSICNRKAGTVSAIVEGSYYSDICSACVAATESFEHQSSGHIGYEKRRGYEDYADEIVQPYNASGPDPEFYRLYPEQAEKIFDPEEIEQVKRQI